ncbi:MAG: tRNA (adenosine(37)-N6)-dimethylallyltransferase MiaA [Micavibrio sp.]
MKKKPPIQKQTRKIKPVTIICGPTASGKSALAVAHAQKTGGVVINADSLQIYNALPILTAQPSPAETTLVPHCLYSALDVSEKCSAQQWRDMAVAEIENAFAENLHPVIVGGTGLYLKALLAGLSDIPDVPPEIRQAAMDLQKKVGNPGFHAELQKRDPVMGARLNPNDTQRLIRAYEVLQATGKSLAHWQDSPRQGPPADWRFTVIIATPDRAELHRRCDLRFDLMTANGALEEVAGLNDRIERGEIAADAPITHALGFTPLQSFIKGGITLAEATERGKAETRQYAKRQDTWFRHQIKALPSIEEIRFVT